jgi:uncharacterized protein (DUF111 family)
MPLEDFDLTVTSIQRNGIHAKRVNVDALDDKASRTYFNNRPQQDLAGLAQHGNCGGRKESGG